MPEWITTLGFAWAQRGCPESTSFGGSDPTIRVIAMLLGARVALASHGAKASGSRGCQHQPWSFSKIALSLIEDVFTIGSTRAHSSGHHLRNPFP